MNIKELNVKFYIKIKKLIKKNGFEIPPFSHWIKLWKNKPKKKIGDGIFKGKELVGYHSYFDKKLIFKGKTYKILVSSNWNVHPNYRKYSIYLINKYFNKNTDIFLTTTSNFKVSEIWKSFGAKEVNNKGCKRIFFRILDINKFLDILVIKKKLTFIKLVKPILLPALYFYNNTKNIFKKDFKLYFKCNDNVDGEINSFNLNYEKNNVYPLEKRSDFEIKNYLRIINHNKKIYLIKIINKDKLLGYCTLVREKIRNTNIHRMYLAELRIYSKYYNYLNEIFDYVTYFSKQKNCSIVEFRNLNTRILKRINYKKFYIREIKNNPYLIKLKPNLEKKFNRLIKKDWETSFLDGDCLL